MRKDRLGLQKEISRIFTGIIVPKKDEQGQAAPAVNPSPAAVPPAKPVSVPPKPVAPKPIAPKAVTTPPVSQKPAAPKPAAVPQKPYFIPEPQQNSAQAVPKMPVEKNQKVPTIYNPPLQKTVSTLPQQPAYEPPRASASQNVYEPPPLPKPITQDVKIEVIQKPKGPSPLLKIWSKISAKLASSNTSDPREARKKKMMVLMMPVLAVVFVFVLVKTLNKSKPARPKPDSKAASARAVVFDGKIDWVIPDPYPENLRDPTVIGAVKIDPAKETAGVLPVRGIVFSEDNPCAVVGDRIVSVGEVVQGATVVKINRDSVEFEMGDKKWTQEVER